MDRLVETSRCREFLGQVIGRAGGLLLLTGEAGVGKTRVLRDAETAAAGLGMFVISVDCAAQMRGVPYAPWVEFIRRYVDTAPRERVYRTTRPHLGALAQLVPDLGDRIWLYDPNRSLVELDRGALLEGIARFWVAVSQGQPVLLSIDGLEMADRESLELLGSLARCCREVPLGIVAAYRDVHMEENQALHPFLESLREEGLHTTSRLTPLGREHLAELVSALLEQTEVPRDVQDVIYGKTRGNPFYATEWVRWLVTQGKVAPGVPGASWPSATPVTLPASVERAIEVRLGWRENDRPPTDQSPNRIAVLPFANMSSDPENEFFADGMTEEMIATVSKVPNLSVISRTSVMAFKKLGTTAKAIGRELDVGWILEGSVRKAGNQVRITVQLIEADVDRHLWSERYDRSFADVFSIQSEIAEKVASELRIQVAAQDRERLHSVPTRDAAAHLHYLRGLASANLRTAEGFRVAIGHFEAAIQGDPHFALAYVRMARCYWFLGYWEQIPSVEAARRAEGAVRKALELDPDLPEAHAARAQLLRTYPRWDLSAAQKEVSRALDLNPNLVEAELNLAFIECVLGREREALAVARRALTLDPVSARTMLDVATIRLYAGDPDGAAPLFEAVLRIEPANANARNNLGMCRALQGRFEEAIADVRTSSSMDQLSSATQRADLVYVLCRAGKRDEAYPILAELLEHYRTHQAGAYSIASAYASLGENEACFEWLDTATREGASYLEFLPLDIPFRELRTDPRFERLLVRIRHPSTTSRP